MTTAFEQVRSVSSFVRMLAVSLMLTAALRVAIVSFGASGPPPAASSAPAGSASAQPIDSGVPRAASAAPLGKAIRVRVSVSVGPDRADVYVDGSRLGQVPFVGDTSCRVGEMIDVEVAPKTGKRLKFQKPCEAGTVRFE
jgi:hypothetical protein